MTTAKRLHARWRRLRPRTKHFLANMFLGVLIESALLLAYALHFSPVENSQNAALDSMMRGNAAVAVPDGKVPPLVFLDIDDATWRNPAWGGGEPYRAPRDRLFTLIDYAFAQGARQVVLDVLIEGRPTEEDELFARKLRGLLAEESFGPAKQLVLVRSIRRALEPGFPDELRPSITDAVVAESNGRIVIGAPYFRYSPDHTLRDWQLLEIACRSRDDGQSGYWEVIPAVQLLVAAHNAKAPVVVALAPGAAPAGGNCVPVNRPLDSAPESVIKDQAQLTRALLVDRWERIRRAFATVGVDVGASLPEEKSLGNRVVFRIPDPPRLNQAQVIPAMEVLEGRAGRRALGDAIVVIGQSYPESADRHQTPLGEIAGSLVLLNGIDSMIRHQVIRAPSAWITLPIVVVLIVFVSFAFARWDSTIGSLISTMVAVGALFLGSYHLFKHGVWMDFTLPLLGIQAHKLIKSFEERIEQRRATKAKKSGR